MNLGFIGTGKIASSVITGICRSKITYKKIIISPRNKRIAQSLKKKFKKIIIAKDYQQIIDNDNIQNFLFVSQSKSLNQFMNLLSQDHDSKRFKHKTNKQY